MKEELKENLSKYLRTDFFFILMITLWSVGVLWESSSNITFINSVKNYNTTYNEQQYHRVSDNLVGEYEVKFNESGDRYAKLLAFSGRLKANDDLNYYVAYENPVEILNFNIEDEFLIGYEDHDISSSKVTFNSNPQDMLTVSLTKGVWCDAECIKHFNIDTIEGEMFSEKDYLFNNSNKKIQPVLAGWEYKKYYSLGDEIPCDSFFVENGYIKIIGFLNKNATIVTSQSERTNLNRYIVLPLQMPSDYALSDCSGKIDIFLYMQCHGIAATKMSKNFFQSYISDICEELNIVPSFYVVGATNQKSYKTNLTSIELLHLLIPIFILIYILLFVIMAYYINSKVNSCVKQYSVLYTFKYSMTQICLLMLIENSAILISSLAISSGIVKIISLFTSIKISWLSYLILLFSYIVLLLMSIIVFSVSMKKYDLSEMLRKL